MADGQQPAKRTKLVGFNDFKRANPLSEKFGVESFHHLEFWCHDASSTYRRFAHGLGMNLVAKSDQSTGNHTYSSYVCKTNEVTWVFTAPLSRKALELTNTDAPHPGYTQEKATDFITKHGLAVRAIGILVHDSEEAYATSVKNGAKGVLKPTVIKDKDGGSMTISEVEMYGDVVLRYVTPNNGFKGPFLPQYQEAKSSYKNFGIQRMDHCVGNVPSLLDATNRIGGFTGFHEFAEFVAEDVGTVDSGLNSMVLASNNQMVLLPINEPTFGTKRKSQIQTYLEQNEGAGVQHIALKTNDIFTTLREMRARTDSGGFDFMPPPSEGYYGRILDRIGPDSGLTATQLKDCEELGVLVDKDEAGVLLQIFTKPLGDRPTIFVEIIQRLGCLRKPKTAGGKVYDQQEVYDAAQKAKVLMEQAPGCGGFGKGNFKELFKSIEDYEKSLENNTVKA